MSKRNHCSSIVSTGFLALAVAAMLGTPAGGQSVSAGNLHITGVPDDWSHHHIIFSNPGTEERAIQKGAQEKWLQIVSDPRYLVQQLKKTQPAQGPGADDVAFRNSYSTEIVRTDAAIYRKPNPGHIPKKGQIKKDWSMSLAGGTTTGAMAPNAFPATYSYFPDAASCSHDYAVYATGLAGTTTQATIVGYTNIYKSTCTGSIPSNAFAYNTGGTATQSPVISLDGTKIAYVQTVGTAASLVLLTPDTGSGGTAAAPVAATLKTPATYFGCTAPCYTTVPLSGGANDTNSSPFYDYATDTIFVGDNAGKLHKITTVFSGTPTEVITGGWPAAASTKTSPILTSPVYDPTSGLVFVGDATGWLHSVSAAAGTVVTAANQNACNTNGFVDAPLVDSTKEYVYVFVGYSCGGTTHTGYINRYSASSALSGQSFGTALALSPSSSVANVLRGGEFDNQYYATSGTAGNLYVCAYGSLLRIPVALTSFATYNTPVSAATTCSPVTEVLGSSANTTLSTAMTTGQTTITVASGAGFTTNQYLQVDSEIMRLGTLTSGTTYNVTRAQGSTTAATHLANAAVQQISGDWIYMSVAANGNATSNGITCTGACLYNYNVFNSTTAGTPTAGVAASGGTSGISIDNTLTGAGQSQIYYTTQGGATCSGINGAGVGAIGYGTHGCAVQVSQSGLQ